MALRLRCLGAAGEVTGSKHLLQTPAAAILVDCGAFQGKRAEADAKNRALLGDVDPASIDALVLSHAHFDHSGLLPLLVKRGFSGSIYSTSATRDLARLIMSDSAHIQARDAEYLAKRAAERGEKFDFKPLYDDIDVVRTMERFVTFDYGRPLQIADGVRVEFFDAGHILGSALIRFEIRDGVERRAIGFSGDLGRKDKPIIEDPDTLPDLDALVLESTYGNRVHEDVARAGEALGEVVRRVVARGGKVFIPSFALERAQEVIYHLARLSADGRLPSVPIYVDSPMATAVTRVFERSRHYLDDEFRELADRIGCVMRPPGVRFTAGVEESKAITASAAPAIVIAASGMCEYGRILHHLKHGIGNERNAVVLVGYQAAHTLGRRLAEGVERVRIFGDEFDRRAEVVKLDAFSAHADRNDLLDYVGRVRPRRVCLVHGEADARDALAEALRARRNEVIVPARGEVLELG